MSCSFVENSPHDPKINDLSHATTSVPGMENKKNDLADSNLTQSFNVIINPKGLFLNVILQAFSKS
jgi:hypothetical protein